METLVSLWIMGTILGIVLVLFTTWIDRGSK